MCRKYNAYDAWISIVAVIIYLFDVTHNTPNRRNTNQREKTTNETMQKYRKKREIKTWNVEWARKSEKNEKLFIINWRLKTNQPQTITNWMKTLWWWVVNAFSSLSYDFHFCNFVSIRYFVHSLFMWESLCERITLQKIKLKETFSIFIHGIYAVIAK